MSVQIIEIEDIANIIACVITKQKDRNEAWQNSLSDYFDIFTEISRANVEAYNDRYKMHENDNPVHVWQRSELKDAWERIDSIHNYEHKEDDNRAYHQLRLLRINLGDYVTVDMYRVMSYAFEKVVERIFLRNELEIYYV